MTEDILYKISSIERDIRSEINIHNLLYTPKAHVNLTYFYKVEGMGVRFSSTLVERAEQSFRARWCSEPARELCQI
jgi:hypothetical protein